MEKSESLVNDLEMASIASISSQAIKENKRRKKQQNNEPDKRYSTPQPNPDNPELLARAAKAMNETIEMAKKADPKFKDETPEAVQKQKLLNRINRYYEYFPFLKEDSPKKFILRDSLEALQEECKRCEAQLQNSQTLENIKSLDILFNDTIEHIAISMGTPAHGLVYEAKKSRMIVDQELKELSIKYESWLSTGPELRYLIKTYTRFKNVVNRNRGASGPIVDMDVEEKYTEL